MRKTVIKFIANNVTNISGIWDKWEIPKRSIKLLSGKVGIFDGGLERKGNIVSN